MTDETKTSQYYIHRIACKAHNKKTQTLDGILQQLNNTLVTFNDVFTPDALLGCLKDIVRGINCSVGKGFDIRVEMSRYNNSVSFVFYDNPNNGNSVAVANLYPVNRTINGADVLQSEFLF